MPASPEVCDRGGDVRVVEVLEKSKPNILPRPIAISE